MVCEDAELKDRFDSVAEALPDCKHVFVIEQNRDGQMRQLIMNERHISPDKLTSVLNYSGTPITARAIVRQIRAALDAERADVIALRPETA